MKESRSIFSHGTHVVMGALVLFSLAAASPRQTIRLFDNWKFYKGDLSNAEQTQFGDVAWQSVSLPHTVNVETVTGGSYYQGYCWYRRHLTPDESLRNRKVFVRFDGAMQAATVWLNGAILIMHSGGYSPFVLDITGKLSFGQDNVVAVQLNNSPNPDIPPGKSSPDFRYYGGLYRDVYMMVTDNLHVSDPLFDTITAGNGVFVTYPSVSSASATVLVKTDVKNEYPDARACSLSTAILASDGRTVQTLGAAQNIPAGANHTFTQSFTVANPRLWSPDAPNLYCIRSTIFDGARVADSLQTTIGIRTIQFTRAGGLQINGVRCKLHGADRHQEYPFVGNAVPASGQYRDAIRMKEGGLSFVRTCHYLQPESFFDACDKYGIAAMACIPGWQYSSSSAIFLNNTLADVKTMVRWYRNHPSVILWEVVHNESDDARAEWHAAAHAEYPGDQMYTCGEDNRYIVDVYSSSTQDGVRNNAGAKPCVVSESGDWDYGGFQSTSRQGRGSGESGMLTQAANHIETLNLDLACPWFSADGLWSAFDYCGLQVPTRSGALDIYRLPKFSYYFHQSQRDPSVVIPGIGSGPMVFIASYWTPQSSTSARVFSNCEQVSLYLNGTLIATQGPDNGTGVTSLPHPPFTFSIPGYQTGTLRAEGKIGGAVKAAYQVQTPGAATHISVAIDTAERAMIADGSDFAIAYASVLDVNGTLVPSAANSIAFSVNGPGTIIGANPQTAEGGIATVLIQTKTSSGFIGVGAAASGLASGSAGFNAVPVNQTPTGTVVRREAVRPDHPALAVAHNGRLTLEIPSRTRTPGVKVNYRIINALGRQAGEWLLDKNASANIDVARLTPGIYLGQLRIGAETIDTHTLTIAR
jgi:hypothetical protein